MVTVQYRATDANAPALVAALEDSRFSRRRSGASAWRVWQDAADPNQVVEQFVVASWSEHLRQHERVTVRDQGRLDTIRALSDPAHPPTVTHWLTPQAASHPARTAPPPPPPPPPGSTPQ
jgi:hypothetical protein